MKIKQEEIYKTNGYGKLGKKNRINKEIAIINYLFENQTVYSIRYLMREFNIDYRNYKKLIKTFCLKYNRKNNIKGYNERKQLKIRDDLNEQKIKEYFLLNYNYTCQIM